MKGRIGIDAGGTLIKLVYDEGEHLHFKTYGLDETDTLIKWLNMLAGEYELCLTGGRSLQIAEKTKLNWRHTDEFAALVSGTRYLLETEQKSMMKEYILVNIGTGTSIFHVTMNGFEHLFGSGMGGGTYLGLGSLLTGVGDFHSLTELAQAGDGSKIDLLVKDIYQGKDAPIQGELTAANFGKVAPKHSSAADRAASLTRMIGENLLLLASQAAARKQLDHIVFIGSTLQGNVPLKDILSSFQDMLRLKTVFLKKGSYAGALGAWLDE